MSGNKFKVTLKGDEANNSLRLTDLIDQLNAIKQTLNQVDVTVSGKKAPGLYYRITKITMNSPATFEVEAVSRNPRAPNYGSKVVSRLKTDLRSVISGKKPKGSGLDLLESYKGLVYPLRKHVSEVSFQFDKVSIDVPRNLDVKVDEILGPDQIELGSIIGSLDVIDIHNQKNEFKVYPSVGPSSIKCHFPKGMLSEAVAGINHFVRISGELHFKRSEKFPHFMKVSSIEILPEKADSPTLSGLRGIAKDAYGGLTSTEYVDKVRNGDW